MRLQKNKPSESLLVIMIVVSTLLVGYGFFRILAFKPVMLVDDAARRVFGGPGMFVSRTTQNLKRNFLSFFKSPQLQKKIDQLEYELRLSKVQIASLDYQSSENDRLKLFMRLITEKDYHIVPCDIWNRDLDNPFNFTINKGKKDQLKMEQGVVYPLELGIQKTLKFQLVGRIQELGETSSRILSLFDPRSKISCRNLRTMALGNVMYDAKKNELYVMTLNESDDYAVHDMIVTSDLSSLPKNIIIGIVLRIEPTKTINKKIILGTTLDFMRITTVAGIK